MTTLHGASEPIKSPLHLQRTQVDPVRGLFRFHQWRIPVIGWALSLPTHCRLQGLSQTASCLVLSLGLVPGADPSRAHGAHTMAATHSSEYRAYLRNTMDIEAGQQRFPPVPSSEPTYRSLLIGTLAVMGLLQVASSVAILLHLTGYLQEVGAKRHTAIGLWSLLPNIYRPKPERSLPQTLVCKIACQQRV